MMPTEEVISELPSWNNIVIAVSHLEKQIFEIWKSEKTLDQESLDLNFTYPCVLEQI